MNLYSQIFRRKSFHQFKDMDVLKEDDLDYVNRCIKEVKPLYDDIKVDIVVVKGEETTCRKGEEYAVLFYSEPKGDYLRNIGYIGEQLDLMFNEKNIATLWCGMAKPNEKERDGLSYVIMLAISKGRDEQFVNVSKRESLDVTWEGETIEGVSEVAMLSPSACNSQPWFISHNGDVLEIYRRKGSGVVPAKLLLYFNQIDIGIYLCILELCLKEHNIKFRRELLEETGKVASKKILMARYYLD